MRTIGFKRSTHSKRWKEISDSLPLLFLCAKRSVSLHAGIRATIKASS